MDLVFSRYHDMKYISRLPVNTFLYLANKAYEEKKDELIRRQWLQLLPLMQLGYIKFMSFDDYKNKCTGANIDLRPTDEIIAEIKKAHGGKLDGYI